MLHKVFVIIFASILYQAPTPPKVEGSSFTKLNFGVGSVRVFTEYLITLGHLLRTNRLRAYSL